MKSDYRQRARKFVKLIYPYIKDDLHSCSSDLLATIRLFSRYHNRQVELNYGQSRYVLITADYVIKWNRREEANTVIGDCESEYAVWEWIHDEFPCYEHLFAEITPFNYEGNTFYIMPRVKGIDEKRDDAWEYIEDEYEYDFLIEHFSDLHGGNFGINHNGEVIIFDYAWNFTLDE